MADKSEIERGFTDLVRAGMDLPEGPGKELVVSSITDAKNSVSVLLNDEGKLNVEALLSSGKAFKRLRSEATNGTSWCC